MRASQGFGLLELMVTLVVVAILSTIAVPSFVALIDRTRLNATVNDFLAAAYTARSHSVRTGQITIVCPSAEGRQCDDTKDFAKGWLVTTDANSPQAVVRRWSADKVRVSSNLQNDGFIRYQPDGLPIHDGGAFLAGTIEFCIDDNGQDVVLSRNGRLRTEDVQC